MKHFSCIPFIILLCQTFVIGQTDTIIQHYNETARSTENEVLYKLIIYDDQKIPIGNLKIWMIEKLSKQVFQSQTDEIGQVYFVLPNGKAYSMNFEKDKDYKTVEFPARPFLIRTSKMTYVSKQENFKEWTVNDTIYQDISKEQYATPKRVLANIHLKDFSNIPLSEEPIYFSVKNSKLVYAAMTDEKGEATLMLPKANTYYLHFKYFAFVDSVTYADDKDIYVAAVDYQYFGSKAIEKRERERVVEMNKRDSIYKAQLAEITEQNRLIDSINTARKLDFAARVALRDSLSRVSAFEMPFLYSYNKMNKEERAKLIKIKVEKTKRQLAENPKYFEEQQQTICATMYRMKEDKLWQNKLIVTDLTGSMTPYMNQVFVWHTLNAVNDENNQYLFFNDGRSRHYNLRRVRGGGGLFFTNQTELENIYAVMKQTMRNGNGGDAPENDIEALLGAIEMGKEFGSLILIADNLSPIKDKRLMNELIKTEIPVKIILAGARTGGSIHEDYLELAYKTGGTLHTLTEDIKSLYKMKSGEIVKIGSDTYRLSRGRFLRIR